MSDITSALWITLIGMALVFVSILILWGLMELILRFTTWYGRRHPEETKEEEEAGKETSVVEPLPVPPTLKKQAAAVAVAVALALEAEGEAAVPALGQPQSAAGQASAWQTVMRSAQLNQRSNQFNRKSRGNVQ